MPKASYAALYFRADPRIGFAARAKVIFAARWTCCLEWLRSAPVPLSVKLRELAAVPVRVVAFLRGAESVWILRCEHELTGPL